MNILSENPWLLYALRTLLASAALFSYYRIFLCNKRFHQANRVFLLGSAFLSLLLPLVPLALHLPWKPSASPGSLTAVFFPDSFAPAAALTRSSSHQASTLSWSLVLLLAYGLIAAILLTRLLMSVYRIVRAAHKYPSVAMGPVRFLITNEPGAPFSFLHWLFWDKDMDPHGDKGRLIFLHESYHIRQRHTLDILSLECIRCLCWFNPFFHLICREIRTVHEFMADHNAVQDADRHNYAELLVWQAATQPPPFLQHPFFNSSIKRRINMIIQQRTRRSNPLGRIMALPVLLLLLAGATAAPAQNDRSSLPLRISSAPADTADLLRLYCKNLRYPTQLSTSHQEGSILFSIRIDQSGNLLDFTPLATPPSTGKMQKIVVMAYPSQTLSSPVPEQEVRQSLLDEARRASGAIGQQLSKKPVALSPGEYYLEVKFSLDRSNDQTKRA